MKLVDFLGTAPGEACLNLGDGIFALAQSGGVIDDMWCGFLKSRMMYSASRVMFVRWGFNYKNWSGGWCRWLLKNMGIKIEI